MFGGWPLWLSLLVFTGGAALIWVAGTRLERVTDQISARTGIGTGGAGLILLAGATSLPEIATTSTAVAVGNIDLAVHNLLGGVALQVLVLVVADAGSRRPLTRGASGSAPLVQAAGLIFILGLATAALLLGGTTQFAVPGSPLMANPVTLLIPVAYVVLVRMTRSFERDPRWVEASAEGRRDDEDQPPSERPVGSLWVRFGVLAALVVGGGWLSAALADHMAEQTGLGSAVVGATLLAAATSLPEVSTTVAAARSDRQELAISNVMGSNGVDVSLLAVASVFGGGAFPGPLADAAAYLGVIAMLLTAVFLLGLLLRQPRTAGRIGIDSLAAAAIYGVGIAGLLVLV